MTSVYKTDFGNGVVIYADDYVKTGRWVFDCNYSRLISREPLPVPVAELEHTGKLAIGPVYVTEPTDRQPAKAALKAITSTSDWYKNLSYLYSAMGETNDLSSHAFYLIAKHAGRSWAVEVNQLVGGGNSRFTVTIEPYDPATYVDYAKALQAAAKSCPVAQ